MVNKSLFSSREQKIFNLAAISALIIVFLIPVQLFFFSVYPPPEHPEEFFRLFHHNWLLGIISLDFLYIINNTLIIIIYLGLYTALKNTDQEYMLLATVIGITGIAAYYSSTVIFEMMALSKQFFLAETASLKADLLASGNLLLIRYKGTAFDIYYVLNALALIIISAVMYRSDIFSRATSVWGLAAGMLMLIPSTAGTLGLIFSIVSLIPWTVFSVLIARRLLRIGRE
jgi:hypothetical protein